jgi:hypothetical protein
MYKLWTFQSKEVLDIIKKHGVYYSERDRVIDYLKSSIRVGEIYLDESIKRRLRSYDWMVSQMESKIGKRPKECCMPIWAFYEYDAQKKKYIDDVTVDEVGIELLIREENVVLTDYMLWHCILNDLPIIPEDDEYYSFKEKAEKCGYWGTNDKDYDNKSMEFEECKEYKYKSWQRVFNVTSKGNSNNSKLAGPLKVLIGEIPFECILNSTDEENLNNSKLEDPIQACLWKIRSEDILNVY